MHKHNIKSELNNYYKQIRANLPNSRQSVKMIHDLNNSINDYTENHSAYGMQDIIETFGSPEEIADSFISSLNSKEYKKGISFKKTIFIGFSFLFILLMVIYIIAYIRGRNLIASYETKEEITFQTNMLTGY